MVQLPTQRGLLGGPCRVHSYAFQSPNPPWGAEQSPGLPRRGLAQPRGSGTRFACSGCVWSSRECRRCRSSFRLGVRPKGRLDVLLFPGVFAAAQPPLPSPADPSLVEAEPDSELSENLGMVPSPQPRCSLALWVCGPPASSEVPLHSLCFTAAPAPLIKVGCLLIFHANAGSHRDLLSQGGSWLGHQWRGWHALWQLPRLCRDGVEGRGVSGGCSGFAWGGGGECAVLGAASCCCPAWEGSQGDLFAFPLTPCCLAGPGWSLGQHGAVGCSCQFQALTLELQQRLLLWVLLLWVLPHSWAGVTAFAAFSALC